MGRFSYEIRFPGQFFDQATRLHYNYFRDYDPRTGRYIESDPVGLAGGIKTYAYAGNNPLTKIDPSGLDSSGTQPKICLAEELAPITTSPALSLLETPDFPLDLVAVAVLGTAWRRAISGRFNYVRTERRTMEFDPAFTLLRKFTVGIESSVSGSDTINNQDITAVAKYLGVELPAISISECIRILETELLTQNQFLTMNLKNLKLYEKSRFVREVILNNRSRLKT